ncbi:MAG: PAS domain-containing protein, partial [Proteobacteria bacterium]|nr:PAS domain-containing protein [Pseudomonadota bacterium]
MLNTSQRSQINDLFEFSVDFKSLIDEIPLGVVVLDTDRRIVVLNRTLETLTGFSQKQVAGIPCHHILRSKICIRNCPVLNMDEASEPVCVESDLINRDRMLIPVRVNIAVLKNIGGEASGFLETVEDLRPYRELDAKTGQAYSFAQLVGRSPQMEKIFQILPVLAQSDSSVLVTGETGTG